MYNGFGVPHEAFESRRFRDLKSTSKVLYVCLCKLRNRYANDEGQFYRSAKDLADDTGMNERTIMRAKKELLAAGFIERYRGHYQKHGWRGADYYQVNGYQSV